MTIFTKLYLRIKQKRNVLVVTTGSIILLLGLFSKFFYLYYTGGNDVEPGPYGFPALSSFMWNLGTETFTITIGIFFYISTYFHKSQPSKLLFRGVSAIIMAVGFYFVSWIFFDTGAFNETMEQVLSITSSLVSTLLCLGLFRLLDKEIQHVLKIMHSQFLFLFNEVEREGYIKDEKKEIFVKRRVEIADQAVGNEQK